MCLLWHGAPFVRLSRRSTYTARLQSKRKSASSSPIHRSCDLRTFTMAKQGKGKQKRMKKILAKAKERKKEDKKRASDKKASRRQKNFD